MKRCFWSPVFFFFLAASGIQAWENQTSSLRGGVDRELSPIYDVLILGAGVAGMAAATELKRFSSISGNPSLSVKVIEGSSRVGGRAVAAGWFSGGEAGHPMAEIAFRLYGVNGIQVETQNWASIEYFDTITKQADLNKINFEFDSVYYCLQEKALEYQQAGSKLTDRTILDVLLKSCNWDDSNSQEKYMRTWYNLQYESADDNDDISFVQLPLTPYVDYQDKDVFLINKTYADIVRDEFAYQNIVVDTGAKVVSVNYGSTPIVVTTESGVVYKANTVIPTFTVGVLKSKSPLQLPEKNFNAMNKVVRMATYAAFTVSFPTVFFHDSQQFIAITPKSNETRGRCNYWQVLDTAWNNEYYPRSHALVCVITTEVIEAIEAKAGKLLNPDSPDNDVSFVSATLQSLIEGSLGTVYPSMKNLNGWTFERKPFGAAGPPRAAPPPANSNTIYYTFANHKYNPLWQGSYENNQYVAGRTYDQFLQSYADFVAPFGGADNKSVRLAGSGTCNRYGGWMQGAYFSGIRAVNEYLDYKYPTNPHPDSKQFCDKAPDSGRGTILKKSKQGS